MPFHLNSLANHADYEAASVRVRFDDLAGEVVLRGEELEILNRPGVEGCGARKLGRRGKPFELAAVLYCPDWQYAHDILANYQTLIGLDPLYLTKQSVAWGTFLVLEVAATRTEAVYSVCGDAVNAAYYPTLEIRLETKWKLLG